MRSPKTDLKSSRATPTAAGDASNAGERSKYTNSSRDCTEVQPLDFDFKSFVFIRISIEGTALAAVRYRRSRYKASINDNLPFAFASHHNRIFYTTRVSAFSFYLKKKTPAKEKQTSRSRSTPANAAPQYLACGSRSAARHIRAQTRRSLNECGLVRQKIKKHNTQQYSCPVPVRRP